MNTNREKSVRFESLEISASTYGMLEDLLRRSDVTIEAIELFESRPSEGPPWFVPKIFRIVLDGHRLAICSMFDNSNNCIVLDIHAESRSRATLQVAKQRLCHILS